jgi:hypothetical protein
MAQEIETEGPKLALAEGEHDRDDQLAWIRCSGNLLGTCGVTKALSQLTEELFQNHRGVATGRQLEAKPQSIPVELHLEIDEANA